MRLLVAFLAAALLPISTVAAQDLYDPGTIRTIEITAPTNWRTVMANNYASKTLIKVDVKIDNVVYRDVGARHRGYSTYQFLPMHARDKRPWRLVLDEYVPGQTVQGYGTLNLSNNIWDPTMVREVVGFEFMRRYMPAPKSCYVRVAVNGEDLGLFTNTQQINRDFLEEWLPEDQGNRYRGERTGTTPFNNTALTWLGTAQSAYQSAYELRTENSIQPPWVRLIAALNVLNNTAVAQLPVELPKVIDVDNALRFLALANLTAWMDSYIGTVCHNFYLYEDLFHGRLVIIPWDVNNGLGGLTDGLGTGISRMDVFYRENNATTPRPLLTRIVQRPEWRARYLAHYRTMLPDFSWSVLGARINQLRAMIRPLVAADTKAIYTITQFDQSMTTTLNLGIVTVPALQTFVQERNTFLATHAELVKKAPTLANLAHWPAEPDSQQSVTVNVTVSGAPATAVTLYHRTRGPFLETPMLDDGNHGDGAANDGVYGATIPAQQPLSRVEYYVGASGNLSAAGAMAFSPTRAEFAAVRYRVRGLPPVGPIRITEVLAENDRGIRDESGEREDWIELTNVGSQPVSLGGMYLTDNTLIPTKWKIPEGQTLQPDATLLVWADDQTTQGPLHASFGLSAAGEEVALFDRDGKTNLDRIGFGRQTADVSLGRLPGYSAFDVTFPVPTPRLWNRAEPGGHLPYGTPGASATPLLLWGQGRPAPGLSVSYTLAQAEPSSPGLVLLSAEPGVLELPGFGPLLVHPASMLAVPFLTDAIGGAVWPLAIPSRPQLVGSSLYLQFIVKAGSLAVFSNAIATRVAP